MPNHNRKSKIIKVTGCHICPHKHNNWDEKEGRVLLCICSMLHISVFSHVASMTLPDNCPLEDEQ